MKVSIIIEETCEDTGEAITTTTYSRDDIDHIQDWLWFLSEASRKAGFSYVEAVGALYNDETEIWSTF